MMYRVFWPGQETIACEAHLNKLMGLANVMGFTLSFIECDEAVCTNCKNEKEKRATKTP